MNKNLSKVLSTAIGSVLALALLTGCSSTKKEEVNKVLPTAAPVPDHIISQISFSGYLFDEDSSSMSEYIAAFNLNYPAVEVSVAFDDVSAESYFEQLDDRVESGEIGSVFLVDNQSMAKYAAQGKIIPLDKYLNNLLNYDSYEKLDPAKDLLPAAYKAGVYNGELYMAGLEYNHKFVFLNWDLIENSGFEFPDDDWSWDDLFTMAEKIKADGAETPIAMDYNDYAIWGAFARSNGTDIYEYVGDENTEKVLNLAHPDVVAGLEYMADNVNPEKGLVDCIDASDLDIEDISKYAFIVADHDDIAVWSEYLTSEECDFEWDYAHFPRWNDDVKMDENGKALYYQSIGAKVYGLAVYNYGESETYNEEYYKACATFALNALVDNAAENYTGDGESVPANKDVNDMKFWREFPAEGKNSSVFSLFADSADFADNLSSFMPVTAESEIDITDAILDYFAGAVSMAESLQELQDYANAGWI